MFRSLCGQEALRNMFLTTTLWSSVDPAHGEFRENRLRDGRLWGGLINIGATVGRFDGTRESGLEIIRKLIPHRPERLEIQDRMAQLKTNAGQWTDKELTGIKEKSKGEPGFIRKARKPWSQWIMKYRKNSNNWTLC